MSGKILKLSLVALCCAQIMNTAVAANAANKSEQQAENSRPNIVYILLDDQRYDAMGFMNKNIQTPNMDQIAHDGVHYANTFVTSSLSSPSRASILTGEYVHNHHIADNNPNPEVNKLHFFTEELKANGYTTSYFGKWHFGGADLTAKKGFAGLDHFVILKGQGDYWPFDSFGHQAVMNEDGKWVPQQKYVTQELTDDAIQWLDHRDKKKPFFMFMAHKGVHADFDPPVKYMGSMDNVHFPVPATAADTPENYKGKPMWVKNQRFSWHGIDYPYDSDLDLQKFQRRYYETLRGVDDSIGEIRQYLKAHNLDKNTVIMVMSDNGFMFGEHGLIDKRNAYEESMRVPLIAEGPGFSKGSTVKDIVLNVDVAPTILNLAGVKAPANYDGKSFVGLDKGQNKTNRKNYFAYEYFWDYDFPYTPTMFAIRTDNYKYIQPYGIWDREELYNMQNDPKETNNLINSKDPTIIAEKIRLRKLMFQSLKDRDGNNTIPYGVHTETGQVFRMQGKPMAEFPEEWQRGINPRDKYDDLFPDQVDKKKIIEPLESSMATRPQDIGKYIRAHYKLTDKQSEFLKTNYENTQKTKE